MAISSEFYKDLSKVEKKIWGITVREFKAYVCFVFIGILLLLEVFFFAGSFIYGLCVSHLVCVRMVSRFINDE